MTQETKQNRPRACAGARKGLTVAAGARQPGAASLCVLVRPSVTLQGGCTRRAAAAREAHQAPRVILPEGLWSRLWTEAPGEAGGSAYLLCLHHILGHHEGGKHPELLGPRCHVAVHPFHEAGTRQHRRQVLCTSCGSKVFPNWLIQKPCILTLLIVHFQHSPNYSNLFFFFPRLFNWLNLKTELEGDIASKYLSTLQRKEHLQYSRVHDCLFKRWTRITKILGWI